MVPDRAHKRFRIDIKCLYAGGAAKEDLVAVMDSTVLGAFPLTKRFLDDRAVVERIGFRLGAAFASLLERAAGSTGAGIVSLDGAGRGSDRNTEDREPCDERQFHGNGEYNPAEFRLVNRGNADSVIDDSGAMM